LKSLQARSVIYMNLDIGVKDLTMFRMQGSPSLLPIMQSLTKQIPFQSSTVYDKWTKQVEILGTGSDYTAFIHHAGIASSTFRFGGYASPYEAVYHSNYDSYYWYQNFGDPTWEGHASLTKLYGLMAMRFADDTILPFDLSSYAAAVTNWTNTLAGNFTQVNFTPILTATSNYANAVTKLQNMISLAANHDPSITPEILRFINDRMMLNEQSFITSDTSVMGEINWFRHVIFKPSSVNSYEGQAFGSLYDVLATGDWTTSTYIIQRIALMINGAAEFISGDLIYQ